MPFDFIYNGLLGTVPTSVDDAKNWDPIDVRNATYRWTLSASGVSEYYLELAAGGDPSVLEEPDFVTEDGADMVDGTAGSLAAGEKDYADNDTLGFSTIYVRLTSGLADPDDRTIGFIKFIDVPYAAQNIDLGNGAAAIALTLNSLEALVFNNVSIAQDFTGLVGTLLQAFSFKLSGTLHIGFIKDDLAQPKGSLRLHLDIQDSSCVVKIDRSNTKSADSGFNPVRIQMRSPTTDIFIRGGRASFGVNPGEVFQADLISVTGGIQDAFVRAGYPGGQANLTIDEWEVFLGAEVVTYDGGVTSDKVFGGVHRLKGEGTFLAATVRDGATFEITSTGDHSSATVTLHAAILNMANVEKAITLGTLNVQDRGAEVIKDDSTIITTTNDNVAGKHSVIYS